MSRHSRCQILPISILVSGLLATAGLADTAKKLPKAVPLDEIPKPVIAALQQRFPQASITSASLLYTALDSDGWDLSVTVANQEVEVGVEGISGSYVVNSISKPT